MPNTAKSIAFVCPRFAEGATVGGAETLIRFKWAFIPAAIVFTALVAWVIYLRYLLARKAIESQAALARYRLELEMGHGVHPAIEARPAAPRLELRPPGGDPLEGAFRENRNRDTSDPA